MAEPQARHAADAAAEPYRESGLVPRLLAVGQIRRADDRCRKYLSFGIDTRLGQQGTLLAEMCPEAEA